MASRLIYVDYLFRILANIWQHCFPVLQRTLIYRSLPSRGSPEVFSKIEEMARTNVESLDYTE